MSWMPTLAFVGLFVGAQALQRDDPNSARILLPFGISLDVPIRWTTSRMDLGDYVSVRPDGVREAIRLPLQPNGHLILFGTQDGGAGEASIEISVFPTSVGQSFVRGMKEPELSRAEREFRTEILDALAATGSALLSWDGLTREEIGGRSALLRRYRYRPESGRPLIMESYGIYLGRRSIQVRVQYSVDAGPALMREVEVVRKGVLFALAEL